MKRRPIRRMAEVDVVLRQGDARRREIGSRLHASQVRRTRSAQKSDKGSLRLTDRSSRTQLRELREANELLAC
jgi:hypothetical protein